MLDDQLKHSKKAGDTKAQGPSLPKAGTVGEVAPIREQMGVLPINRAALAEVVEGPLLSACQILFDKNVRTVGSSANHTSNEASFSIDIKSLSDTNREIALRLGGVRGGRHIYDDTLGKHVEHKTRIGFRMQTTPSTPIEEISKWAEEIAQAFEFQEPTWVPRHTIEEMQEILAKPSFAWVMDDFPDGQLAIDDVERVTGYHFDEPSGLFYLFKEHVQIVEAYAKKEQE